MTTKFKYPLSLARVDAALLGIRSEPGWTGDFTRRQAPGAKYPNGTRIIKSVEDEGGDETPVGLTGTVLGSIHPHPSMPYAYFVEWDHRPKVATFMAEHKVAHMPENA